MTAFDSAQISTPPGDRCRRALSPTDFAPVSLAARVGLWLILCLALLCLGGCAGPKFRLGTLPYPGIPVLHKVADPEKLGQHRYQSLIGLLDKEQERGIIYTREAGFIDVAHLRHTIDWTRAIGRQIAPAIADEAEELAFDGAFYTRVHLRFDYPPGWEALAPEQKRQLGRDLAILMAQQIAYALGTWHEIITWWGFSRVPFFPERRSAFTYDDGISHLIGLEIAGGVLREGGDDYGAAVTAAINEELARLGAVPPNVTRQAVQAVEGWWWNGGPLKRHVETGYGGQAIHPMRVPGFGDSGAGATFKLPSIADIDSHGLDLSGFYVLELEPKLSLWRRQIRPMLPWRPQRLVPERDIPPLMEVIRWEMRRTISPTVDVVEPRPPAGE